MMADVFTKLSENTKILVRKFVAFLLHLYVLYLHLQTQRNYIRYEKPTEHQRNHQRSIN